MGIKALKEHEISGNRNSSGKFAMLSADIMQIIDERVPFCELTEFPYSDKTALSEVQRNVNSICDNVFFDRTGKRLKFNSRVPIIALRRERDEKGNQHIYAKFYTAIWDRLVLESTDSVVVRNHT